MDNKAKAAGDEAVAFLFTAGPLFIPDFGQVGPRLESKANGAIKATPMVLRGSNVIVTVKSTKTNKPITVIVPLSYCSHIVLE
jgi:hypothetical protein